MSQWVAGALREIKRGRELMNKSEWKLLCVDAINICGRKNIDCLKCEVRCTKIIRTAQKKLLEYLISEVNSYVCGVGPPLFSQELNKMLKQLEGQNG